MAVRLQARFGRLLLPSRRPPRLASFLAVAALAWPPAPLQAQPAQVLLIRHGHKESDRSSYNLSRAGLQRSLELARLIPACFGTVSHIVTYALNPETGKNARSYQSAVPLAVFSGINIRIALDSDVASFEVGRRLRDDPSVAGGHVVVFWEHRRLPALAAGLGWPSMPALADDDFDSLDLLRYGPPRASPAIRRYSQSNLLAGSQPCPEPGPPVSAQPP